MEGKKKEETDIISWGGDFCGCVFFGGRGFFGVWGFFWGGGGESFRDRGQIRLPPNFNFLGKLLLEEKYVEGKRRRKKKKKERKNNAKFSGHYVCPRTETVREHALRSHQ